MYFEGRAEEAMNFHAKTFDTRVDQVMYYKDEPGIHVEKLPNDLKNWS